MIAPGWMLLVSVLISSLCRVLRQKFSTCELPHPGPPISLLDVSNGLKAGIGPHDTLPQKQNPPLRSKERAPNSQNLKLPPQIVFANATAVSDMRLEKPHSLSYQESTRTKLPSMTLVWSIAKIEEWLSWLKSRETSGSSV